MRRAKPLSVVVKAPSRGLVMRLPSISADLMPSQSGEIQSTILSTAAYQRAAAASQNVRYEDGVVCAAPGYERIVLSSALLQGMVAYWPLTEAGGTRFDATPNYLNLTDIPGTDNDVTSGAGILNGLAALFSSIAAGTTFTFQDKMTLDGALSGGFISPLAEYLPNDLFTVDGALSGGYITLIVLPEDAPDDLLSFDGALDAGTYTLTVVVDDAPEDSLSFDGAIDAGTYTLTVIVTDAPEDSCSMDSAIMSGSYTQTITEPHSDTDSFAFDTSLTSGSYD